jgi:hypothetical protein
LARAARKKSGRLANIEKAGVEHTKRRCGVFPCSGVL